MTVRLLAAVVEIDDNPRDLQRAVDVLARLRGPDADRMVVTRIDERTWSVTPQAREFEVDLATVGDDRYPSGG